MTESKVQPPLIWIDLEMTGLEPEKEKIIEIATIVTDGALVELHEGLDLVVHESQEVMDGMDEWCTRQHGQSGLTEAVLASQLSLARAEQQTLELLRKFTEKGRSPLAGSSVSHDRRFIARHMPELAEFLHYRTVDVSSVKELVKRWFPSLEPPRKGNAHRALDDIRESIAELRFYRDHAFKEHPSGQETRPGDGENGSGSKDAD